MASFRIKSVWPSKRRTSPGGPLGSGSMATSGFSGGSGFMGGTGSGRVLPVDTGSGRVAGDVVRGVGTVSLLLDTGSRPVVSISSGKVRLTVVGFTVPRSGTVRFSATG